MKDELLQRMMADLGWLAEQIGEQTILKDYLRHKRYWEADRIIRDQICKRLRDLQGPINDAIREASEDVRAGSLLSALEGLLNLTEKVANHVRAADYGHSALGANIKVNDEDLASILAHDRSALEQLLEATSTVEGFDEATAERLKGVLVSFEKIFDKRTECLRKVAAAAMKED